MDRWKAEMGRAGEKRRVEERRSEKRKSQKKEDAGARKGRKVAKQAVFPMICGSGGSKSRLAKAAGAEPSGQMRDEKLHAVVARSLFPSQNVQNTTCSDHFWKLRCWKSARRCGAKHISKSKCTKHTMFGPRLEVEISRALLRVAMWKKCTPLWREAHFEVKMYKTHQNTPCSDTLEVEMSKKCTPLWRETHFEVKISKKTPGVLTTFGRSDVVLRGRCKGLCTLSKVSKTWKFCSIFKYNHHYTTLHSNTLHYNYNYTFTTFHDTTLHYTPLHSTTLHYTQLHAITLNYTTLHYTTLHSTTLHYTTFHYTTLHYTTLHSTTLHYVTFHYIIHYTTLHSATLHCTILTTTTTTIIGPDNPTC